MNVEFLCPHCRAENRAASLPAEDFACKNCGQKIALRLSEGSRASGMIDGCAVCGKNGFYLQKDFNPRLGLLIFAVGVIFSYHTKFLSLFLATAIDFIVFYTLPTATGTLVERLRITEQGGVGIGVPSVTTGLHVANDNLTTGQLILGSQRTGILSGNVLGGVEFWSNDSNLATPGILSAYFRARAISTHSATDVGSELQWALTPAGSATPVECMRINFLSTVLLGGATAGSGLANGLVMASGTAPATSQADTFQWWVQDYEGTAGQATLHLRSEAGDITKIGPGIISRAALQVEATATIAAPRTLTADDYGKVLVSNSATMAQLNLPLAVTGAWYCFTVHGAAGLRIRAASGDNIRFFVGTTASGVDTTAAAGAIETTTIGATIHLVAVNGVTWTALSQWPIATGTVTAAWTKLA